jgi:hypothetical protein
MMEGTLADASRPSHYVEFSARWISCVSRNSEVTDAMKGSARNKLQSESGTPRPCVVPFSGLFDSGAFCT